MTGTALEQESPVEGCCSSGKRKSWSALREVGRDGNRQHHSAGGRVIGHACLHVKDGERGGQGGRPELVLINCANTVCYKSLR